MMRANESDSICADMSQDNLERYVKNRIPVRPVHAVITMLACLSVLGLLGNALVLYVYVRKRNKLSSTVFIIALAATDLVTSALSMPYTIIMEALNYKIALDVSCKLYYFVITCTVPFSVFIMVAIAIDRYLCICRPLSRVLDSHRARNSVFALLALAVLMGTIPALFHGVYMDKRSIKPVGPKSDALPDIMSADLTNISDIFNLLGATTACQNCFNQSNVDGDLSEHLSGVIHDLITQICDKKPPKEFFTGRCLPNQLIFSETFRYRYQTFYSSSFLVCFAVVFVLYLLIYRSVLTRRLRRLAAKKKSKLHLTQDISCSITEKQTILNDSPDKSIALLEIQRAPKDVARQGTSTLLVEEEDGHTGQFEVSGQNMDAQPQDSNSRTPGPRTRSHNSCLRDKCFLANIRTAIMLFVVTLAFVIAYLPSWLMVFKIIPFNVIVFYIYFSNHIVNPVIYAFMNPAFRRALKGLICRKSGRPI